MNESFPSDRPIRPAIWNGWRKKCPNCGSGKIFNGYLKVNSNCNVCDLELHHHRADDGPAYLTILLVGHIMAPFLHIVFVNFRPDPWVLALMFCSATLALCLYLLPRLKGVIIAFQWARNMHGFGQVK